MAVGHPPGVHKVTGDADARTITVEFEPPAMTVEAFQEAMQEVGYESTLAQ